MYSSKCFGVCVIISVFVVRCLNIKRTTFVKILERRMCPFITKLKVLLKVILALFYEMNYPSDFTLYRFDFNGCYGYKNGRKYRLKNVTLS